MVTLYYSSSFVRASGRAKASNKKPGAELIGAGLF
jgi:hypothetical protein